jgi:hypothetical protein
MAEVVKAVRDAAANNSARRVGMRLGQPNLTAGEMAMLGTGNQSDFFAMPVDSSRWQPLQDVTIGSATLGMLYFIPDLDVPGNPNRLVR